jgi:zona occludens toxin
MITVITGTPGAGKTLYAISKLLFPIVGTSIEYEDEHGQKVTAPRTIYTNINGLLLDHELVQFDTPEGLRNWHNWAKPGSLIVIDEFQRLWNPRPNGAKIPDEISALDTHRHMGVDFILITQNVMNADRHIHGLTNRHLHVRRVANMKLAVVYEWDHCSRTLQFSKSITKAPWRYDKNVFKYYKSAKAHTTQPRKMPGLVWFLLLAVVGMGVLGPTTYARLYERTHPKPQNVAQAGKPGTPVPSVPVAPASAPAALPSPALPVSAPAAPLAVVGCAAAKGVCRCYDAAGKRAMMPLDYCTRETDAGEVQLGLAGKPADVNYAQRVDHSAAADKDVLSFLAKRAGRVPY